MRSFFSFVLVMIVVVISAGILYAQVGVKSASETDAGPKSYPIQGSHLLWKQDQAVREYIAQHPDMFAKMKQAKSTAWTFVPGDTHSWYSVNFTNSTNYLVPSTCRAVGVNCYIFVENAIWGTRVTQAVVDSVKNAFDSKTPANPSKGVYQMDVDAFGTPPDIDSDSRIIILILNIQDGWAGSGGYVAGYFYSWNETNGSQSNQAEIYFLDANPADLKTPAGLEEGLSTTAHEFQHMIHWAHDPSEISFVNEGCSLVAEVNCGYPIYDQSGYITETNHYLLDWRYGDNINVLHDYSRAARFATYLRDQLGMGVFQNIVASTLHGIAGLDDGFLTFGTSLRFNDIFKTWLIANILDDTTVARSYGYVYPNLPKATGTTFWTPNVPITTDTVKNLGARYLIFKSGTNLQATLTASNPKILIKAVETGPSAKRVLDVTSGVLFSEPAFGTTYTEVIFVVMNTDQSVNYTYTYQASGSGGTTITTLSYADAATYYILLPSSNQKFAMRFTPTGSGSLYSVSVAINGGTSAIKGSGSLRISAAQDNPSGSVAGTPGTQIGSSVLVPFNKLTAGYWNDIDMSSANVSVTNGVDFHIVLEVVGGVGDTLQFLLDDGTTSPTTRASSYRNGVLGLGWYNRADPNYASGRTPSHENLLVSATIAVPVTGIRNEYNQEIPAKFSLKQNYPNPFNPTTEIQYTLPKDAKVRLDVYNMLGQKITTLIDGIQSAGLKSVGWSSIDENGKSVPSGIYFYRIEAAAVHDPSQSFVQVNKMVLVK